MKISLLLLFLSFNFLSTGQVRDCKSLHEGKFKITDKESGTTIITRKGNVQKEENTDLGVIMVFDIKWIDECSFELWPKEVLKGDQSYLGKKGDFMTVKIQNITANSFTTVTSSNFFDAVLNFEVEILE